MADGEDRGAEAGGEPHVYASVVGVVWIQAGAWRPSGNAVGEKPIVGSLAPPLMAVLSLLLIFQLLLRPGIRFY